MKKTLIPFIVLLLVGFQLRAQTPMPASGSPGPWSVGLSVGPAFPVGKFTGQTTTEYNAVGGFARPGLSAELSGRYRLSQSFGAALVISGQENPVNTTAIAKYYQQLLQTSGNVEATSKNWKMVRILVGEDYTLPLKGHALSLQIRALGGVLKTHTPANSYFVGTSANGPYFAQGGSFSGLKLPWSFCYQGDAALLWNLQGPWSLIVRAGYSGARPTWKNTYTITTPGGPTTETYSTSFPLGTVYAHVGVEWQL